MRLSLFVLLKICPRRIIMKDIYSANDYAHLGSDSKMIQAAVDAATKARGTAVIPSINARTGEGIWHLDEGIRLHSGSHVILDGAHLRLCDGTYINFFLNDSAADGVEWWRSETRQRDITIEGRGDALLDGGVHNGLFEHSFSLYDENGKYLGKQEINGFREPSFNRGVMFRNVERVAVSGLRFVNQRYWGMCFEFCSSGHVKDIIFEAQANVPNQDGIDVREGCNNFLLENISGLAGDDMIALTNFGVRQETDMDTSIHNVMIRNVRAFETSSCDMIRLLSRGGHQIYNVQISGVVDLTPVGDKRRPLAGIRIGDLNDYPSRLNEPGEMRNVTVRDVVTRARFGVYCANTLVDAVFDNIQMVGDGGIGVYFNGAYLENIYFDKLLYSNTSNPPRTDVGYEHKHHRVLIDRLMAVGFNNTETKNVVFRDVVTAKGLDAAFYSNKPVSVRASGVVLADGVALTDGVELVN